MRINAHFVRNFLAQLAASHTDAQESQGIDKQSSRRQIKSDPYQPLTDVIKS